MIVRNVLFGAVAGALLFAASGDQPRSGAGEAPLPAAAAAPAKDEYPPHRPVKLDLTEGERLTYVIKWGVMDAGEATLTVKRKETIKPGGPEVWNVQCKTRSNSFISFFYEVRDSIKTCIDTNGGFSRLFDMDKNEGRVHANEHIEFDYDRMEARYVKRDKTRDKVRTETIKLPGEVHDPLSCLYYARGLDLRPGSEHRMTVNTSRKNWVFILRVLRRETLEIDGFGKLRCLVLEPRAQFQGIFVRKGQMTVWVEEKTRIPVQMKVGIPIGAATARLYKAENCPLSKPAGKK